jgi:hypothetical protein
VHWGTAAKCGNPRGRGVGHLWLLCDACHEKRWHTMFYEPPHDIRHHRASPWLGPLPESRDSQITLLR